MRADKITPVMMETLLSGSGWKLTSTGPHHAVSIAAVVPNDISDDLERAGLLPDLWYGLNSQHAGRWVLNQTWKLSRAFEAPPAGSTAAWLAFDGVDYNCSVAIDGKHLANHVGAFEPDPHLILVWCATQMGEDRRKSRLDPRIKLHVQLLLEQLHA